MSLAKTATWYAQQSLPVFPLYSISGGICDCGVRKCHAAGKHPHGRLVPRGFKEATTNLDSIAASWDSCPWANIGMPTGEASGIDVVDIDPRNGGLQSANELAAQHGKFSARDRRPRPLNPAEATAAKAREAWHVESWR